MYFKKTHCKVCNHSYDSMESKCPYCDEVNSNNMSAVRNPNGAVFPFWKQLVLFLVGWLGFQIIANFIMIFVLHAPLSGVLKSAIVNYVSYIVLGIAMGLIVWTDWKKLFKSFKGWKPYVFGVVGFAAIMTFSNFWNIVLQFIPLDITDNANQASANSIVSSYPLLGLLILGFVGPICEELTYRVGLFSFSKRINRVLGYVITLVVFALIHFDFDAVSISMNKGNWDYLWNELLNLPFYVFAGATFTFLYEKFGFASSVTAHIVNNTYSVIMTIIASFIARMGA